MHKNNEAHYKNNFQWQKAWKLTLQSAFAELSPWPKFHSLPFHSDRPEVIDKKDVPFIIEELPASWNGPY